MPVRTVAGRYFEAEEMTHVMKLHPTPFGKIKSGNKSIELRLYDEKRRKISVGDEIRFVCTDSGEELLKKVIALHIYASFRELYDHIPLEKCGYSANDEASPEDMRAYYSAAQEKNYGVVGIELL